MTVAYVLMLAILAHKWAASFALACQISQSGLSTKWCLFGFVLFSLMAPAGVIGAAVATPYLTQNPLLEPCANAIAAGTFLYLGTLHGLEKAIMVKHCCNLRHFAFVIFGFCVMSLVALWT
jgi:zinc transporter 1/2/3